MQSKEYLEHRINENLEVILKNIDQDELNINIHFNGGTKNDFPRMFFTLFTLARTKMAGFTGLSQSELVKFGDGLYEKMKATDVHSVDMLTVQIYYMRMLGLLGQDISQVLRDFENGVYTDIYKHSVSMYLFMCLYVETGLKDRWSYSETVFNNCLKNFDFMMYSSLKTSQSVFAFSELSALKGFVPEYLLEEVTKFYKDLRSDEVVETSSSGIAKCLEHCGRVGDMVSFQKLIKVLDERKLANMKLEYFNPSLLSVGELYLETGRSQYISLDTNTHLVNAYLNLYERQN